MGMLWATLLEPVLDVLKPVWAAAAPPAIIIPAGRS
jgi:hypothetical protein